MHEGKIKAEDLSRDSIKATFSELNKAAKEGYGNDWADFNEPNPNPTVLALQKNLFRFSGAKTYAMQLEIQSKMYDGDKLRPWNEFMQDALRINKNYNRNYLQAEWQTARQAAHHARNWEQYEADADLFPNLKYKTTGDNRVRKEHEALNGVVKPINDPFWDKYYPPNGWRCRCYVVQTAEKADEKTPEDLSVKPEFQINVGKERKVFRDKIHDDKKPHTFFALYGKAKSDELRKAFELSKLDAPLLTVYKSKTGGEVKVSPFKHDDDYIGNYNSAVKMANVGYKVEIRPHIDNVDGYTNPEYRVNGIIADRKAIQGINNMRKVIDDAKKQMYNKPFNKTPNKYTIVFDLNDVKNLNMTDIEDVLKGKVTYERGKHIESMIFIKKDIVIELTRDEIVRRKFKKLYEIQ